MKPPTLYCLALLMAGLADAEVHVTVTGKALDVNGQTTVPRGLLGLHADAALTPERAADWGVDGFRAIHYIPGSGSVAWDRQGLRAPFKDMPVVLDCQGDRFVPATVLTKTNYVEHFRQLGREYAQKCRDLNWLGYAEFWNEPYLNWAERSRKNYDPKYYDVTKATDDGPVTIKGWDQPLRYLRWRRLWAQDAAGKINHLVPVPKDAKPGDTFTYALNLYFTDRGPQTYTVVEKWDVYDPTAVSFWSGKQNYDFYLWMFLPWAQAIKETNPNVTVIGGWDFPPYNDGWQAWDLLYRPLIDDSIQWLDGVCEHHYGSNTRANAGSYEVIVGYALAEHGKRLRCFNTETAGCVDPAVPGNMHGNATPYGAFNYGLRDIVELWYRSPDKAVARAAHGSLTKGWGGGGDEFCFKLLKEFRGRLMHATSSDLDVWPVAALNSNQLVVVLYNDRPTDQPVALKVDPPAGATFASCRQTTVEAIEEQGALQFKEAEFPLTNHTVMVTRKTGVKLTYSLVGKPAPGVVTRRQFFAKGIRKHVTPDQPVTLAVALPAPVKADSAWVKVVLEGVQRGEGIVRVNDTEVPLPEHDWITEIPIPPGVLREQNRLEFRATRDGYDVDVASVVVETAR